MGSRALNASADEVTRNSELIVGYDDPEAVKKWIDDSGFRIVDHIPQGRAYVIAPVLGVIRIQALKTIAANPSVRYLSMNRVVELPAFDFDIKPVEGDPEVSTEAVPNDPFFNQEWGFKKARVEAAWETARESKVIVAIIDTGIDLGHPDLGGPDGNLWVNEREANGIEGQDDDGNGVIDDIHGATFLGRRRDGNPQDDNGHGTHCAGTIGAVGNNGRGIAGLNWRVSLMGVKALNAQGAGSNSDIVKAIYYAIRNGAQIISNSYGGSPYDAQLKEAIDEANRKGILFVTAAGNRGSSNDMSYEYPAVFESDNIINVGALDREGNLAYFSNFGRDFVHIAAPGVNIVSTYPVAFGSYKFMSGTSMAAPFVAGAAALIWDRVPGTGRPHCQEVREVLLSQSPRRDSLKSKIQGGTVFDLAALMGDREPSEEPSDRSPPLAARPVSKSPLPITPDKSKPAESAGRSERFVYQQKVLNDLMLRGKGNLLSVEFELKQAATVRITAHASVHTTQNNSIAVGTGFSRNADFSGEFWKESWRGLTVPASSQTVSLAADFITELPTGKHKIYWRVFTANETDELRFSEGGALIVDLDPSSRVPSNSAPSSPKPVAKAPSKSSPSAKPPTPVSEPSGDLEVIKVPLVKQPSDRSRSGVKSPPKKAPGSEAPVAEVPVAEVPDSGVTPSAKPD